MIENIRAVIAGPSECGKTTVARAIARRDWQRQHRAALVYDPHLTATVFGGAPWGASVVATPKFDLFERLVWNSKGYTVIMDEATVAIDRDSTMTRYFTEIRHRHPAFYLLCHDASVLLPVMRQQLTEGYIFRQTKQSAAKWAEVFVNDRLLDSSDLGQFEYLHVRCFRPVVRSKPALADLEAGRL